MLTSSEYNGERQGRSSQFTVDPKLDLPVRAFSNKPVGSSWIHIGDIRVYSVCILPEQAHEHLLYIAREDRYIPKTVLM